MSLILVSYRCACGRQARDKLLRRPAPEQLPCECGNEQWRTYEIGGVQTQEVSVVRSTGPTEAPPTALNTRALAEGGTMREFRKARKRLWRDRAWADVKRDFG